MGPTAKAARSGNVESRVESRLVKRRRPKLVSVAAFVVCAAATVLAFSMSHPHEKTSPSSQPFIASIAVPLPGKLSLLLVHNGESVAKGQLIAELDSSAYESELKNVEAELQQSQTQTQSSIMPMQAIPGITGTLPRQLPQPVYEKLVVPKQPTLKPAPQKHEEPPAISKTEPPKEQPGASAAATQKKAQATLEAATQELAKSSAALAAAQKDRDALRPKITQARVDAEQAAKKAGNAKELLDAGVISAKRSQELLADKDTTQKALEDLQSQVTAADKTLSDTQTRQQTAQSNLDKATADLKSADDLLAKSSVEPVPQKSPASPVAKPAPKPRPQPQETRIVMRRMPMTVRTEPLPAIPVKVFVDEKAMQNSEEQTQALTKRIEELKAKIAACRIFAPVAGTIEISTSGEIRILG